MTLQEAMQRQLAGLMANPADVVSETWSDEARAASAEVRKAGAVHHPNGTVTKGFSGKSLGSVYKHLGKWHSKAPDATEHSHASRLAAVAHLAGHADSNAKLVFKVSGGPTGPLLA